LWDKDKGQPNAWGGKTKDALHEKLRELNQSF